MEPDFFFSPFDAGFSNTLKVTVMATYINDNIVLAELKDVVSPIYSP